MATLTRLLTALVPLLIIFLGGCQPRTRPEPPPPYMSAEGMLAPAPGVTAHPEGGPAVNLTVTGTAGYHRHVPLHTGLSGYQVFELCRFVTVQAVTWQHPRTVLAQTTTDHLGRYSLSFSTSTDYYIRVLADMTYGPRVVVSASSGFELVSPAHGTRTAVAPPEPIAYAVCSPIQHRATGNATVNVYADTKLPYSRAGAFSILGTLLRCLQAVEAAGGLGALTGRLNVVWAPGNLGGLFRLDTPTTDFIAQVPGTAFAWLGEGIDPYLLVSGGRVDDIMGSDHDEYDDAVIAHEFCHYLMFAASRDQNWGGPHSGEALVPAAAYSEGLPTALGCALLGGPDYIDTVGLPPYSSVLIAYSCENPLFLPGVSGYESEFSVTAVAWDILDGANALPSTDGDSVAVYLGDFLQSLYALAARPAPYDVIWLASLLQQLIDDGFLTVGQADLLMASQGAAFPPLGSELWPDDLGLPDTVTGSLDASTGPSGTPPNPWLGPNANAVFRLELAAAQDVTFTLAATPLVYFAAHHMLDLYVYDLNSNLVFGMSGTAQSKSAIASLPEGVYMVRVHHAAPSPQLVSFSLTTQ